eukprot:TRINITY_DN76697_c0_g1_i1.p2 TRINITY_DN76697_c0_g1~~TRINITY_DN76697_c0_g1_i1.p2  ORF type:complete len:105 (-),score=3.91 TRINITY_DN76697_c0_g1_i1:3-317(-)
MKHVKSGNNRRSHKQMRRKKFEARHLDLAWDDVQKGVESVHDGSYGPVGNLGKVELDEDIAGFGKHFCISCSRYFINLEALETHRRTKFHKRLKGEIYSKKLAN